MVGGMTRHIPALFLVLLAVLVASCTSGARHEDTAPVGVSVDGYDDDIGLVAGQSVALNFSKPLAISSVTNASIYLAITDAQASAAKGDVAACSAGPSGFSSVSASDAIATLAVVGAPPAGSLCAIVIVSGVEGGVMYADGNPYPGDCLPCRIASTPDPEVPPPPEIAAVFPASGATGVPRFADRDAGTLTAVSVTFNKEMDASTITAETFTLEGFGQEIHGTVAYDAITRTATFTPVNLFGFEVHAASLSPEIRALDGTALTSGYTWRFTLAQPRITEVATGFYHNLALAEDGTVWAWGDNAYGQLGNGTRIPSSTPLHIPSLVDITAINGGYCHSLALRSDGSLWAWGSNGYGTIGTGTSPETPTDISTDALSPVAVPVDGEVARMQGCYHFSLALMSDGTLKAWGRNNYGQLGDGTQEQRASPVTIQSLTSVVDVGCGSYGSVALTADGDVWSWGSNYYGYLGIGSTDNNLIQALPEKIAGVRGVAAISSDNSAFHVLALTQGGDIFAWGYNASGQIGNGTTANVTRPELIDKDSDGVALGSVVHIVASSYNSFATTVSGRLLAWGTNARGQLGDGVAMTSRLRPQTWAHQTTPRDFATGDAHTVLLDEEGDAFTAGNNSTGQLGNDTGTYGRSLHLVPGLEDVRAVASGYGTAAAITGDDGRVWTWGQNSHGQLGNGTKTASPIPVAVCAPEAEGGCNSVFTGAVDIGVSRGAANVRTFVSVLRNDGTVWSWGNNYYGQMGNGTYSDVISPGMPIQACAPTGCQDGPIDHVKAIKSGSYSLYILRDKDEDGRYELWSWGEDTGALANGNSAGRRLLPVRAIKPTVDTFPDIASHPCADPDVQYLDECVDIAEIAGNYGYAFARGRDGSVWAWSKNESGYRLGVGLETSANPHPGIPWRVKGEGGVGYLENIDRIYTNAGYATFAVSRDGTMWAWGTATLLMNSTANRPFPEPFDHLSNPVSISTGSSTAYAIEQDGNVLGWGESKGSLFGTGAITPNRETPEPIPELTGASSIAPSNEYLIALIDGRAYQLGHLNTYSYPAWSTLLPFVDGSFPISTSFEAVRWSP